MRNASHPCLVLHLGWCVERADDVAGCAGSKRCTLHAPRPRLTQPKHRHNALHPDNSDVCGGDL